MLSWASAVVWPLMSILPILLSTEELPTHYSNVFPEEWYKVDNMVRETVFEDGTIGTEHMNNNPKPLGLILGILAVFIGHVFLVPIFYLYRQGYLSTDGKTKPQSIQSSGARDYHFGEGLQTHLSQPEGFVLLGLYLTVTWMLNLMPQSYYSFEGTIQWGRVFLCLAAQDGLQYAMHRLEHRVSPEFYKLSHKPHHRFTNPRLFDAFNGSVPDTVLMILLPLFATANLVRDCNVWTYMAFGSMYANWLVLIHSEYVFPWDGVFRSLGLGTPADHHVHHKLFKYNYGHLFLWFDQIGGTYRDPQNYAPKIFNVGV
eukprot:CAMPEP_0194091028 /NCGR_PEP_ID=MMETSP0149-20130528/41324_1 /TAXON_ID=122233 /ORGANISM="Chaetoceros debilis, Strain MM31A-1" /LENGTH=313 /DNA_ID=CAMNT_0038775481 /DNA_START=97 /DNA_END=1038 /DNA_ORIENTATION=-